MEYNSQREKLAIREYGRNIQQLVNYASGIEEKEKRQQVAEYIIQLMGHLSPHLRNVDDFRHKLWDHLFLISDFKLEVDSPFARPKSEEQVIPKHLDQFPYPKGKVRFKHYGKNVETMISKAGSMTDEEKQGEFAEVIGNYMKMVYKNWNRETVNDEQIRSDLALLSENKLNLRADSNLDSLASSNREKRRPPPAHAPRTGRPPQQGRKFNRKRSN